MRLLLATLTLFGTVGQAAAQGLVDPFINPIAQRERALELKLEKLKGFPRVPQEVHLFKPKTTKPIEELSIQGVIGSGKNYLLVLLDPETGETFILKEGDPVAPNEKIVKITPKAIILYKFRKVGGKLQREEVILNVDTEGFNNG